ncbi:MAG TPA: hypothetical protein VFT50_06525 [Baekduia sp.]|nr:hypothetical protein [Baekduia sp.]
MRLRLRIAIVLALAAALCAPSLAHASGAAVVRDCADGTLDKTYSQKDYADALAHMPADVDEYTDCRDVIRRAQLGGAGGGPGGGSGFGGLGSPGGGLDDGTGVTDPGGDPLAGATPEERASFAQAVAAATASTPTVKLDGRPITAGDLGGSTAHDLSSLPTPLLVLLALLVAAGLGGAGVAARRRVVHGRNAI